jgi:hypothetical protein
LDFKLIFNEHSKTVEGDIDSMPNANTGVGSSSNTRISTVSNKQSSTKKPGQAQSKQQQRQSKASKQQFNEDQ